MNFGIGFGAFAPSIAEQLKEQGIETKGVYAINHFQLDADAITRCVTRGLIPEHVAANARRRILKRIIAIDYTISK